MLKIYLFTDLSNRNVNYIEPSSLVGYCENKHVSLFQKKNVTELKSRLGKYGGSARTQVSKTG